MTSFLGPQVETVGTAGREQPQDTGECSRAAAGQQRAVVFGHFGTETMRPASRIIRTQAGTDASRGISGYPARHIEVSGLAGHDGLGRTG